VSCAALAESVLESELFGHAGGAFTGAVGPRKGLFELAHGGTVFLDEVQEASPKLQAELLRVLETGEVRPVGAGAVRRVDVRVVAATNADLRALVEAGGFREDLYHRLNVLHVRLPALRDRVEDIPELVAHLLARGGERGRPIARAALEKILAASWPGNVRALRNCLQRALVLAGDGEIRAEHVTIEPGPAKPSAPAPRTLHVSAIELNERQLAVIEILQSEPSIGNAEYSERVRVSQATGWRDLADLVAKGVLVATGKARRTTYQLAPAWRARVAGE
jgi:Nif-specific regulatory protein